MDFEHSVLKSSRYLYGLDFGQELAQNYFFDFWAWEGMLIPPSCVRSQSHDGKLDFLAKIATKNSQNRQLAEFRQTYYTKLVEHQILIEKMVSYPSLCLSSQKIGHFKDR